MKKQMRADELPNPKMPAVPKGKYKATMNEYDHKRPKKQVMTRIAK